MSEKVTEDTVLDLSSKTKKDLDHILKQLEVQKAFLEAEELEITVENKRLVAEQAYNKVRFSSRGTADGVFYLTASVNESTVEYLCDRIDSYVHAHRGVKKKDKPGITLVINSPGGDVFEGLRLYDELRAASLAGHKVTTLVRGMAASMAAVLMQAGDERVMGPEAMVMIHEVSSGAWGKQFEIEDRLELTKRLTDQLASKIAERSGRKKAEVVKMFDRRDCWLNSKQCLDLNFADRVG